MRHLTSAERCIGPSTAPLEQTRAAQAVEQDVGQRLGIANRIVTQLEWLEQRGPQEQGTWTQEELQNIQTALVQARAVRQQLQTEHTAAQEASRTTQRLHQQVRPMEAGVDRILTVP